MINEETPELDNPTKDFQEKTSAVQRLASLGMLLAGVSHEIKNPLNYVNNFSKISIERLNELEECLKSQEKVFQDENIKMEINGLIKSLKVSLDKIMFHGERAENLIMQILTQAKGTPSPKREVLVHPIINEALNLAYHSRRGEDISFNIKIQQNYANSLEKLKIIPEEISRVLINIFQNAFYSTIQKKKKLGESYQPELTITTKEVNNEFQLIINDNGLGMSDEVKKKIFQPFFSTKPFQEGFGLGLSLSREIICKDHQGTLTFESQENEFAEFTICLPKISVTNDA